MALFFSVLILVLLTLLVRLVMAAPLMRTLSMAIDSWADSVQGDDC
ncbi:MAG TPA: hypothetical protein VFU80_06380 [Sphingomicrobium sp.]|nr:hypothetical protein [Sphingomicrobium sp.]